MLEALRLERFLGTDSWNIDSICEPDCGVHLDAGLLRPVVQTSPCSLPRDTRTVFLVAYQRLLGLSYSTRRSEHSREYLFGSRVIMQRVGFPEVVDVVELLGL